MRRDKNIAFQLRKEGRSYEAIKKELGVSKSTLCSWFKNETWSKHIKQRNNNSNILITKERILKLNMARKSKLDNLYLKAEDDATREFEIYKNEPLFMAGLMVYAGEGDKVTRFNLRMSNSEFYLHKFFIKFSEKYLDFKRKNMKCALILYGDNDISKSVDKWSEELGIPKENFHKTQVIIGKEKIKRLQFGVGMVIISSTFLKKKLLKWLELCKEHI